MGGGEGGGVFQTLSIENTVHKLGHAITIELG